MSDPADRQRAGVVQRLLLLAAVWRELRPGAPPPEPDTRRMPAALLVAINGFLVFVSLMAVLGIWLASS